MQKNPFANPPLEINLLQKVLDHWHKGRIKKVTMVDGYHKVTTVHGRFIVFALPVEEYLNPNQIMWHARENYLDKLMTDLDKARQPTYRLLLKNPRGEYDSHCSTVHYGDWYYRVYEIIPPPRKNAAAKRTALLLPPRATRKSVARALFMLTEAAVDNQPQLQQLYIVADALRLHLNNNPEQPYNGLGTELACWIGLLIDTPTMGLEYRQNLIDSFPAVLGRFRVKNKPDASKTNLPTP